MKRTIFIALCVMACVAIGLEARTVRDFFINEPNDIFMLIAKGNRMDLLDYYDDGRLVSADNNLGGGTQLKKVATDYLSIQLSESNTVEMKLLYPSKKDTVIAVINTVKLPAEDSQIVFYDTKWNKLNTSKIFVQPTITDFVLKNVDKQRCKALIDSIDIPFISYSFNQGGNILVAHQNAKDYLNADDYNKIKPYLRDSLTYEQKGLKFKLSN